MVISNSGVLYDWPAAYTPNAGPMDSNLMVQLREEHSVSSIAASLRIGPAHQAEVSRLARSGFDVEAVDANRRGAQELVSLRASRIPYVDLNDFSGETLLM